MFPFLPSGRRQQRRPAPDDEGDQDDGGLETDPDGPGGQDDRDDD